MANPKEEPKKPTHKVISEFRDIADFNLIHEVDKDVSAFAPERLADLVSRGLVEEIKPEQPVV